MTGDDVQQLIELDRSLNAGLDRIEREIAWLSGYVAGRRRALDDWAGLPERWARSRDPHPGDYAEADIRRELFGEDGAP
jgi:hypothetical protein